MNEIIILLGVSGLIGLLMLWLIDWIARKIIPVEIRGECHDKKRKHIN